MPIDYNHGSNHHTPDAARVVLPLLRSSFGFRSVLDVGCGIGTWLRAAIDEGVHEYLGIDGVDIAPEQLLFDRARFQQRDFEESWTVPGRYDLAICLEVAEHLSAEAAPTLIECICAHATLVLFSAAAPHQPGQHHVNCQWPEYWQSLFNRNQFECLDAIRMSIWSDDRVDPWYRQNIFVARRSPEIAGTEPRIPGMIHPIILSHLVNNERDEARSNCLRQVREGLFPPRWYGNVFKGFMKSTGLTIKRRLHSAGSRR